MGSTSGMLAGADAVCLGAMGSGHREPRARFPSSPEALRACVRRPALVLPPAAPQDSGGGGIVVPTVPSAAGFRGHPGELGFPRESPPTAAGKGHTRGILSPNLSCCANWGKGRSHERWQNPFPKAPAQVTVEKPRS